MARGPKKHMKRVATPSHWMLDKLSGVWAPRPSTGPHKLRECLPLACLLRNRLKLALNYREAKLICMQRLVKVDGKARVDQKFPTGLMDVVSLEKTKDHFRMLYDTKGRFVVHKVNAAEASYKLCRVQQMVKGKDGVNHIVTHDGRTIRFPDPETKVHDTVRVEVGVNKLVDGGLCKFEHGNVCMITGGNSIGRVGVMTHREKHPGSFEIVHLRDTAGNNFATRVLNVMVIGKGDKAWISLPKGDGVKLSICEDRTKRMEKQKRN